MSIVIAHPVFFLLSCRLFVSLADDMKWKYSLSLAPPTVLRALFWHLKNATGSWNHSWAPTDWLAHRLPLNFRCLRSCLRRDRWCLCRWMNTLLCALPFGLNISVSNVTNQMFVSRYVQPLCMLLGDLCIWIPVGVDVQPWSTDNVYSLRLWYIRGIFFEYAHSGMVVFSVILHVYFITELLYIIMLNRGWFRCVVGPEWARWNVFFILQLSGEVAAGS